MKHFITALLLGSSFTISYAQQTIYYNGLSFNNTSAIVNNNGTFFHDYTNGISGYTVPKVNAAKSIFFMNLMAMGTDANNQLRGALSDYTHSDFQPGPIGSDYTSTEYHTKYETSLWKVTRSDIEYHIAHWNDSGYQAPLSIQEWPGNGDTSNAESMQLAPYFDADNNGIYDFSNGDYPIIRGDEAVYCIVNDDKVHPSGVGRIGLELHLMFYQYSSVDQDVNHTTFINARLFNRGTQTLYDFHIGSLIDFDLGNPMDDYLGTAPAHNLAYVYNADFNDESYSGQPGFGTPPPSVGVMTLSTSLNSHIAIPGMQMPSTPASYYNLLTGKRMDGSNLLDGNSEVTTFSYYDNGFNGWNEVTASNIPGDRKSVIGCPAITFTPENVVCYDFAVIYAPGEGDSSDSLFACTNNLIATSEVIQSFYNQQAYVCPNQVLGLETLQNESIELYPNPVTDELSVKGLQGNYRILSMDGKTIFSGQLNGSPISTRELTAGFYLFVPENPAFKATPFLKN